MTQVDPGREGVSGDDAPVRAEPGGPTHASLPALAPDVAAALGTATAPSTTEAVGDGPSARRRGHFALLLVALLLVIGAWSFATPLMASPDEPTQAAQAAALVRGQIDEPQVAGPFGAWSLVRVPAWVHSAAYLANCFAFRPDRSARCPHVVGADRATVTVQTQFSNYPPLYFAWVGLPSLALVGSGALYAMRLASALANAALLALGIYLLARFHPRRLTLVGALIAITPMVLFLSAVIDNSGLEITAAFASWCAGLCVIENRELPTSLAVWTSISFGVLILSRPVSPYNAAVVLLVLAALAGRRRLLALRRTPKVLPIVCAVLGAAVVAGVTLLIGGSPSLLGRPLHPALGFGAAFHKVLVLDPSRLEQAIGLFGWTDTPIPHPVTVLWIVLAAGVCLLGLLRSARFALALVLLAVAILAMPVIFEIPKINEVSTFWQGRYWLPLLVGIPLTATAASGRGPLGRGAGALGGATATVVRVAAAAVVGGLVVWAQIASFLVALHRYTTGLGRPAGTPVEWTPPGGTTAVVAAFVLGELLLVGCLTWLVVRPERAGRHGHQADGARPQAHRAKPHRHSRRSGSVTALT